jgi:hypothetical protein
MASRLVRANAVTVNDVLDGHTLLEIDCVDRVYLTLSVPNLVVGAEGVWSNLKGGLGNLAPRTTDQLATLARTRLKQMQYRPGLLDGFIAETGLIPQPP